MNHVITQINYYNILIMCRIFKCMKANYVQYNVRCALCSVRCVLCTISTHFELFSDTSEKSKKSNKSEKCQIVIRVSWLRHLCSFNFHHYWPNALCRPNERSCLTENFWENAIKWIRTNFQAEPNINFSISESLPSGKLTTTVPHISSEYDYR